MVYGGQDCRRWANTWCGSAEWVHLERFSGARPRQVIAAVTRGGTAPHVRRPVFWKGWGHVRWLIEEVPAGAVSGRKGWSQRSAVSRFGVGNSEAGLLVLRGDGA